MAWLILLLAAAFEVCWAIGLKYTEGFTRPWPTAGTVAALILSVALLAMATHASPRWAFMGPALPIGTAYAVWTGLGAVGTAVLGIVLFSEPATALRLTCLALIVAGVVGLKFA